MSHYTALLDANVLYPAPLRDLFLQLAVTDIFKLVKLRRVPTPGKLEGGHLGGHVLVVGGDSGIADLRCSNVSPPELVTQYRFATPKASNENGSRVQRDSLRSSTRRGAFMLSRRTVARPLGVRPTICQSRIAK